MNIQYIKSEHTGMPTLAVDVDSTVKRLLSLEPDFMSHRRDDRLYACLLTLSTYSPEDDIVYVTKSKLNEHRKEIMNICNYSSKTTFYNNLNKWTAVGLIKEAIIDDVGCWVLENKKDFGKYQLINLELVRYMIWTCSSNTFRVYAYLLNKWIWKKRKTYDFTLKELLEVCEYTSKTPYVMLGTILENMQRIGLIKVEITHKEIEDALTGAKVPVLCHKLTYMAEKVSQLPAVTKCT